MSERDPYPNAKMREAIGKRRNELGNKEVTIYCSWTGVDCPTSMYQGCETRPMAERLYSDQDLAENAGYHERSFKIEDQLEEIALKMCDFEKFVGQEFEEFDI